MIPCDDTVTMNRNKNSSSCQSTKAENNVLEISTIVTSTTTDVIDPYEPILGMIHNPNLPEELSPPIQPTTTIKTYVIQSTETQTNSNDIRITTESTTIYTENELDDQKLSTAVDLVSTPVALTTIDDLGDATESTSTEGFTFTTDIEYTSELTTTATQQMNESSSTDSLETTTANQSTDSDWENDDFLRQVELKALSLSKPTSVETTTHSNFDTTTMTIENNNSISTTLNSVTSEENMITTTQENNGECSECEDSLSVTTQEISSTMFDTTESEDFIITTSAEEISTTDITEHTDEISTWTPTSTVFDFSTESIKNLNNDIDNKIEYFDEPILSAILPIANIVTTTTSATSTDHFTENIETTSQRIPDTTDIIISTENDSETSLGSTTTENMIPNSTEEPLSSEENATLLSSIINDERSTINSVEYSTDYSASYSNSDFITESTIQTSDKFMTSTSTELVTSRDTYTTNDEIVETTSSRHETDNQFNEIDETASQYQAIVNNLTSAMEIYNQTSNQFAIKNDYVESSMNFTDADKPPTLVLLIKKFVKLIIDFQCDAGKDCCEC